MSVPHDPARMRIHPVRVVQSGLFVAAVLFILLNFHILLNVRESQSSTRYGRGHGYHHSDMNRNEMHVQLSLDGATVAAPDLVILPELGNVSEHSGIFQRIDSSNLTAIKHVISRINNAQHIYNLEKFGLKFTYDSVVILIQVHDRVNYLKILLDSLRHVRGIENSLVIVSHDYYSEALNDIVRAVVFCPITQIFFPYSIQIYPDTFPGNHPNDCPRDIKKEKAQEVRCNNADSPDKYGHYREAKYSQTKHHWFWKINHVFNGITILKEYSGMVLLLEDDYYLSDDAITILQMLSHLKERSCKDCQILSLGNYAKVQNYAADSRKADSGFWISSKHNLGMAFRRDVFRQLHTCSAEFCGFDDYNWDWTLQHLSIKCFPERLKAMKMKASRVFHMGECGLHQKGKDCHPDEKRQQVEKILTDNKNHLFPNILEYAGIFAIKLRDPKPNGGWGDTRDHNMCLRFANDTTDPS